MNGSWSAARRGGELARWLSRVLTAGTLLAMMIVAAGVALAWATGGTERAGADRPLLEVLAAGGAGSIIAGGLLTLALVPLAQLAVAVAAFGRLGEDRYLILAALVLVLLLASLATAFVAAHAGGG